VLHGEVKMVSEVSAKVGLEEKTVAPGADDFFKMDKIKDSEVASQFADTNERTLTVGMHFGEVGVLLPQTPCIATCVCSSKCTLLTLESAAFLELFGKDPNLLAEMQLKLLRDKCSLKSALNHKRCRALFTKHIESEFSGESISFFDDCQSALTAAGLPGALEGAPAQALHMLAKKLIDEYIAEGSNQQVNIPGGLQTEILNLEKGVEDKEMGKGLAKLYDKLRQAQGEIYLLMSRDNFPRFIKGEGFIKLLEEIGSYGESVKELVSEQYLTLLVQDGEGGSGGMFNQSLQA